jgi:hypothetical protein
VYDTVAGILVYITHRYSLVTGVEGIILGLVGLGLVVGSFFVGRGKPAPRSAAPPAAPPPLPSAPLPSPDDTARQSGIFGLQLLQFQKDSFTGARGS